MPKHNATSRWTLRRYRYVKNLVDKPMVHIIYCDSSTSNNANNSSEAQTASVKGKDPFISDEDTVSHAEWILFPLLLTWFCDFKTLF